MLSSRGWRLAGGKSPVSARSARVGKGYRQPEKVKWNNEYPPRESKRGGNG
jgi:hypothetical protein